jgi:pyruvate/2-oxoglutarate dehydrogenase complex dihydrolipoamide acyltransferase (E2) component
VKAMTDKPTQQPSADQVQQRALEALKLIRKIAAEHGITEEDVLGEIQAYRQSKIENQKFYDEEQQYLDT